MEVVRISVAVVLAVVQGLVPALVLEVVRADVRVDARVIINPQRLSKGVFPLDTLLTLDLY